MSVPNQKQPICPATGEWMNKLWPIHVIEHSSAIKGSEVLILETIQRVKEARPKKKKKRTNFIYTKFQNMKTTLVPESRSLVSRIKCTGQWKLWLRSAYWNRESVVWVDFYKNMESLGAQMVKNLPAMQEIQVWSLDWEDPLEKEMATHSSTFA